SVSFSALATADTDITKAKIKILSGFTTVPLTGTVDQVLSGVLVAQVTDQYGNAVSGLPVALVPSDGLIAVNGGAFGATTTNSDANGRVTLQLELGAPAIVQTFKVQVNGNAGGSDTWSVTAQADGKPATALLSIVGADTATGTVNQPAGQGFKVLVTDSTTSKNVLEGMQIDWTSTSGVQFAATGSSSYSATFGGPTDSNGEAVVLIALGKMAGGQGFTATINGTSTSVQFSATALPDFDPVGMKMSIIAGNNQTGTVNQALPVAKPLVVAVTDTYGNALPSGVYTGESVSVSFSTGATFLPVGQSLGAGSAALTDGLGHASSISIGAKLGTTAGAQVLTASVASGPSVSFDATAQADMNPALAKIVLVTGTPQTGTVAQVLGAAIGATVEDNWNNPVGGVAVRFTALEGGSLATAANGTFGATLDVTSDASGKIAAFAKLGTSAHGPMNAFQAAVTGGSVTVFYAAAATADPSLASALISIAGGNNQTGTVAQTLSGAELEVLVTDRFTNTLDGVSVTFTMPPGSPVASAVGTTGDFGAGVAGVQGTLGSAAGAQTIVAALTGNAAVTVPFSMTATVDPALANATLFAVSGGGQSAVVGTGLQNPLVFLAKDEFNNIVPGLSVNLSAVVGGAGVLGAVSPASVTTDNKGLAQFTATVGTAPGGYTFHAAGANGHGSLD
ncbi:MAG: hypothetical protein ACRELB_04705, partial [Polyangiaceae bacterium]